MSRWMLAVAVAVVFGGAAPRATAQVLFTGQDATGRQAEALFNVAGGNLTLTLSNLGDDVLVPTDVLTGLFFDIAGSPTLSRLSAIVPLNTVVFHADPDPTNVGGEWAYRSGLSGAPGGAKQGISSSGLGLFGAGDRFPGGNLSGPDSPDGLQYGITSSNDNLATGNSPVTGGNPLIKYQVFFTLGSLPAGFELSDISNVTFQYGTALTEPHITGECEEGCGGGGGGEVPTPPAMLVMLAGGGAAWFGVLKNRLVRK